MSSADLAVTDAFRAVAAQGEEQEAAEFGRYGMGEQQRRPLNAQEDVVER